MSDKMKNSCKPMLEALEDRLVMTNYLILDWTPAVNYASLAATFNSGKSPAFLDFNRDGRVNNTDVTLAAQAIASRTAQYLKGFDIQVRYADPLYNDSANDIGSQWLRYGASSRDEVFVIYVGGNSGKDNSTTFTLGEAYQAPVGYVNEIGGNVYSESARNLLLGMRGATTTDYVTYVASAVAHEFGHLVGLGHVKGNPGGDNNIMNYNANKATATIPNKGYSQIELLNSKYQFSYGYQNPAQELTQSLRGEPTYYSNVMRGRLSVATLDSLQVNQDGIAIGDDEVHDDQGERSQSPFSTSHDYGRLAGFLAAPQQDQLAKEAVSMFHAREFAYQGPQHGQPAVAKQTDKSVLPMTPVAQPKPTKAGEFATHSGNFSSPFVPAF